MSGENNIRSIHLLSVYDYQSFDGLPVIAAHGKGLIGKIYHLLRMYYVTYDSRMIIDEVTIHLDYSSFRDRNNSFKCSTATRHYHTQN